MCGPPLEKANNLGRSNVAAMDHMFDRKALKHAHCGTGELDLAVRIADNPENHTEFACFPKNVAATL